MNIGVLALQGAVAEHIRMIEQSGATGIIVKRREQLNEIDGIIIPGGESTTIGKLMREYGFIDGLKEFYDQGKPLFGTCAGLIVLAKEITGQPDAHLQLMDIQVARNAFGRQRESFEADLDIQGLNAAFRAVFIRAPLIERVGSQVEVLASWQDRIVAAKERNLLVTSFHPELTDDARVHEYFVHMVEASKATVTG